MSFGTCGGKVEEKPFCECDPQYWGEKCENLKPCYESNPCKNGGKKINIQLKKEFTIMIKIQNISSL